MKISLSEPQYGLLVFVITIIGIVLLSMFGGLMLVIFGYPVQGLFYNMIFGLGILAFGTFIIAVYEELKEGTNGISE